MCQKYDKGEDQEMGKYSIEKNIQMLVSLMKQHNVRKVIVSPGMKNMPFIASVQFDPFFEVYSCVDERSAAYMACGIAVESGEPVTLSCTGATASRNYISALTEAYYNNIPILAITSMSHPGEIGHLIPQIIDRSYPLKDIVKMSVQIEPTHTLKDEWDVNVKINKALLELRHNNGGPVLINLICSNLTDFTDTLLDTRKISRFGYENELPQIDAASVAVFVGIHRKFDKELTAVLDDFCAKYNGVVLCDNTSNYYGKYRVCPSLLNAQAQTRSKLFNIDLVIHIGDVSDGQELAASLDIKYLDCAEAVNRILTNENVSELLSNDEVMTICVVGSDDKQSDRVLSEIESCTAGEANTYCYYANSDEVSEAHNIGLSYGKYRAYLELLSLDPTITVQEVQDMTMRQIRELIDSLSDDSSSAADSEDDNEDEHIGNGTGNMYGQEQNQGQNQTQWQGQGHGQGNSQGHGQGNSQGKGQGQN